MDKIRIVLIDDNKELCRLCTDRFAKQKDFEVIGVAHDGAQGLKLIKEQEMDVIILDISLPVRDGLSVLEDIQTYFKTKKPLIIMFTAMSHDMIVKKSLDLGADFIILKPFDTDILTKRIYDLYQYQKQDLFYFNSNDQKKVPKLQVTLEQFTVEVLLSLGIASNLKGFNYLKTAVLLSFRDRTMLDGITKILYPTVAKECNTTYSRVERAIRHAIAASWSKGYHEKYKQILGYSSFDNTKPTNSLFIYSMVQAYDALDAEQHSQ